MAVSPPLRTVRLVDDDGATPGGQCARASRPGLLGHLEQSACDEGELLEGCDDHRNRIVEGLRELPRTLVDPMHDPALVLELVDRILELLIEDDAICDHDDGVEDARVGGIMERREPVGQPPDRVALAASRGMFHEVVVPHALAAGRIHQGAHGLQLVVAREDHGLRLHLAAPVITLRVDLQMDESGEEVEQAVALQHLLPQVGRAVVAARRVRRVSGCSVATSVEGEETRGRARETGGHEDGIGVHGEVHQRAALELEDRLAGDRGPHSTADAHL